MKTRGWKQTICLLLIAVLAMQLAGCAGASQPGEAAKAVNLMAEITPHPAEPADVTGEASVAATDFALRLFRAGAVPNKNTLISPLSVLCALAMTANGAEGMTRSQMEQTLGLDRAQYNAFFRSFLAALAQDDQGVLHMANSIWFTDDTRFTVNQTFLQTNADHYGADVFKAPFDETTVQQLNGWVKEKTDGMIPAILNEIPPNAIMYLVNALAFDAKWEKPYRQESVASGTFHTADGSERTVDFMGSEEHAYLEDNLATGFVKYYQGGRFAFAALLPNEGVSVESYLASLNAEGLRTMLAAPKNETVLTALPKFEASWSGELSELLKSMGMTAPFDDDLADFTGLGTSTGGNISISQVLHKTYVSVDEGGTRAGAATAVEMTDKAAIEEPKQVYLDRPFVYLLIDCQSGIPLFIGTMMDPNGK